MANIGNILAGKGPQFHSIPASATALDAVHCMNEHKIGALMVTRDEEDGQIAGIFTERDVLRRVVADGRLPAEIQVAEVMTADVMCCTPNTEIDEASRIMRDYRVRHLPVCDEDGRIRGLISIGDLNAFHASDTEATIQFLNEYIHGRV